MMRRINIYFKGGRVFSYPVSDHLKAREHMAKIWRGGYRHVEKGGFTWYGKHYIDKMHYEGDDSETNYPDSTRAT